MVTKLGKRFKSLFPKHRLETEVQELICDAKAELREPFLEECNR